jgi:hypothetical protein
MAAGEGWPEQTLDQIEGVDWGDPTCSSYVVTNSHRLRKTPLKEFTPEDLRFLLGQQISLPILMPMALDVLERDPFVRGDMDPGALLNAALRVDPEFWRGHSRLWDRLRTIVAEIDEMARLLDEVLRPAAEAFRAANPDLRDDSRPP